MKILILSCNTGQGHNSCAAALKEHIISSGDECEIADTLAFISQNTSETVSKLHAAMYRRFPEVWDIGYSYCDKHPELFKAGSPLRKFITLVSEPLVEHIRTGHYDVIVCPHVFPAIMLIGVKNVPKYFLATDYTCSPCVNICDCDGFFIPDESLKAEFALAGIPEEKLFCTGIPIHKKFTNSYSKQEAKRMLGLDPEKRHLLMACGSMGCGPLYDMAERIEGCGKPLQATVVCGSNEKLLESLTKRGFERVKAVGFTDKMPLYMDSADLYLTKPGGISVTESAIKHTPLALINAVAGCETSNFNFFGGHGAAVCNDDPIELIDRCVSIIFDDERLLKLSDSISFLAHPNASQEIYKIIKTAKNRS